MGKAPRRGRHREVADLRPHFDHFDHELVAEHVALSMVGISPL
jgi:hypothetical protein